LPIYDNIQLGAVWGNGVRTAVAVITCILFANTPMVRGAECTLDAKFAAKIERTINSTLHLSSDDVYVSGPTPQMFFPWDAYDAKVLSKIYGREIDSLPGALAIPKDGGPLRTVFDRYRFIIQNVQLAPTTLSSDALKARGQIEAKLYTDHSRDRRTDEYEFYLNAKKELEATELELKGIDPAKYTNLQKARLRQARQKLSVDADGAAYGALETELLQIDSSDLSKWLPERSAILVDSGPGDVVTFPNLSVLIDAANWTHVEIDYSGLDIGDCLGPWPNVADDYSAWSSTQPLLKKNSTLKLSPSATTGAVLSFEIARLDVLRPWIDTSIFSSRAWRLAPPLADYAVARGDEIQSLKLSLSGNTPDNSSLHSLLPFVSSKLVFARNLRLQGFRKSSAERSWLTDQMRSRATTKYGPFAISGNLIGGEAADGSSASTFAFATIADDKLEIDLPQRIGTILTQIAASPRPDSIFWQDKP
jgi:hypothetical protein